jgi:hypothetical protein
LIASPPVFANQACLVQAFLRSVSVLLKSFFAALQASQSANNFMKRQQPAG